MVPSLPLRVCVWLVKHPGRVLFAADISEMFGVGRRQVYRRLSLPTRTGLLKAELSGREVFYSMGPELERI